MPATGDNSPAAAVLEQELAHLRSRVQHLEAVHSQTKQYRLLAEQVPAILWTIDQQLRYTSAAGAAMKFTGLTPEDVVGHSVPEVTGVHDPEGMPLRQHLQALRGETVSYEFAWNDRIFRSLLEPLHDAAGEIIGAVGIGIDITERIELEQALRRRVAAESLLTSISTEFIAMQANELDAGIDTALQRVGQFAGADRAYVFRMSEDGSRCSNTHEWCEQGIEPMIDRLQDVDLGDFPWLVSHLQRVETLLIPDVQALPPEADAERHMLGEQDIRSLLAIPLAAGGRLIGFLGFDAVRARRTWHTEDSILLRTCGEVIAGALQRLNAEKALRDSEAVNRSIIEAIPDMLFRLRRDGTVLTCNVKHPDKLAHPAEHFIGKRLRDLGWADVDALYNRAIEEVSQTGRIVVFEYQSPPERGSRYWEIRVVPCGQDEVMALVRDVTARTLAERTVKERDRFLSTLISNLPGCVYQCRIDEKWTMDFVSDGIADLLGYPAADFMTGRQTVGDLMHPDDRDHVWSEVQTAVQARRRFEVSYRLRTRSGEYRWIWEQGTGVVEVDGSVNVIEGFIADVTQLKQTEQSLQKNHALLRMTLDEMDHRVRNNLAGIAALIDITSPRHVDVQSFSRSIKDRVHAMAEIHALLSRRQWINSGFKELLQTIVPPDLLSLVHIDGPDVPIAAGHATAIGKVFHELVANSLKYGALRSTEGRLEVTWRVSEQHTSSESDRDIAIELTWQERCGHHIDAVVTEGLGTGLIRGIVRNDLRGEAVLSYQAHGANHRFTFQVDRVASSADADQTTR